MITDNDKSLRRMALAKDVLNLLGTSQIRPVSGEYFFIEKHSELYVKERARLPDIFAREHMPVLDQCHVCAQGAMMVALLQKQSGAFEELRRRYPAHLQHAEVTTATEDMGRRADFVAAGYVIRDLLSEVFDLKQLQMIECAYEGSENIASENVTLLSRDEIDACDNIFCSLDRDCFNYNRIEVIFNNILRYDGVFRPEEETKEKLTALVRRIDGDDE